VERDSHRDERRFDLGDERVPALWNGEAVEAAQRGGVGHGITYTRRRPPTPERPGS